MESNDSAEVANYGTKIVEKYNYFESDEDEDSKLLTVGLFGRITSPPPNANISFSKTNGVAMHAPTIKKVDNNKNVCHDVTAQFQDDSSGVTDVSLSVGSDSSYSNESYNSYEAYRKDVRNGNEEYTSPTTTPKPLYREVCSLKYDPMIRCRCSTCKSKMAPPNRHQQDVNARRSLSISPEQNRVKHETERKGILRASAGVGSSNDSARQEHFQSNLPAKDRKEGELNDGEISRIRRNARFYRSFNPQPHKGQKFKTQHGRLSDSVAPYTSPDGKVSADDFDVNYSQLKERYSFDFENGVFDNDIARFSRVQGQTAGYYGEKYTHDSFPGQGYSHRHSPVGVNTKTEKENESQFERLQREYSQRGRSTRRSHSSDRRNGEFRKELEMIEAGYMEIESRLQNEKFYRRSYIAAQERDSPNPVQSNMAMSPVQTKMTVSPIQSKVAVSPVQNKMTMSPVQSEMAVSPMQSKMAVSPVQNKMAMSPVQSKMAVSPMQSKMPTSPMQNKTAMSPTVGQAVISRKSMSSPEPPMGSREASSHTTARRTRSEGSKNSGKAGGNGLRLFSPPRDCLSPTRLGSKLTRSTSLKKSGKKRNKVTRSSTFSEGDKATDATKEDERAKTDSSTVSSPSLPRDSPNTLTPQIKKRTYYHLDEEDSPAEELSIILDQLSKYQSENKAVPLFINVIKDLRTSYQKLLQETGRLKKQDNSEVPGDIIRKHSNCEPPCLPERPLNSPDQNTDSGADTSQMHANGHELFYRVSTKKKAVDRELEKSFEVTKNSNPAVHKAASNGELEILKILILNGASVNSLNAEGWPALHGSLQSYHFRSALFLIEAGADVEDYTNRRVKEYQKVQNMARKYFQYLETEL